MKQKVYVPICFLSRKKNVSKVHESFTDRSSDMGYTVTLYRAVCVFFGRGC